MKTLLTVLLRTAALSIFLGALPAVAQDAPLAVLPRQCEATVAARTAALGLTDILKRGVSSEIRNTGNASGYRARLYNPTCGGYLVFNLTSMCGIEGIYTTGNCRMSGMAHW